MPIAFMSSYVGNLLSSSSIKLFAIEVHLFYILTYNCPIFLGDHGHNSSALINFVQHVKLLLKAEGNIVHLCGGLSVPNYQQHIRFKFHQIHKMLNWSCEKWHLRSTYRL